MYPEAKKEMVTDNYHGNIVEDPYRWLENSEGKDTIEWVSKQNELTENFLKNGELRDSLKKEYKKFINYEKYSIPTKKGGLYFFEKNDGLQNQSVLYLQNESGDLKVVLDPNQLSKEGTTALAEINITKDGKIMVYGLSENGSDWRTYKIKNIETGIDYPEIFSDMRWPSITWLSDNSGFYYSKYPSTDETFNNKVYFHKMGDSVSNDSLVFEDKEHKERAFAPYITDDNNYLTLTVWEGTNPKTRFYYKNLKNGSDFVKLFDKLDARYEFLGNINSIFYFFTDKNAPNGKIISVDIENPTSINDVVKEREESASLFAMGGNQFFVTYMKDASDTLLRFDISGKEISKVELPTLGSIGGLQFTNENRELFIQFSSFLYPPSIFKYDFEKNLLIPHFTPKYSFDPQKYESKQIFYKSKDGTKIPLFIVHKKGVELNGQNPTLLYGYGGFGVNMTPYFSTSRLLWLEHGGVYALAILRGGGEYGERWHQDGMLSKKQNVFDDFISAGEWLINNKYTSSSKLAIMGGSNGGLLVAAVMVQKPELFGAVVCEVPLTDMLRYHKFTVGHYWIPEYGNAENSKEEFETLYKYSPLHNVKKGTTYPSSLIMSADTDDRVVPLHAKKFAAMVQSADSGKNPIFLRIERKAGHGHGKPISKIIDEVADIYTFLFKTFEMK
ncbi:S9 family peptidase [bacterium]|nr:S9 family peptidase [bacterium]